MSHYGERNCERCGRLFIPIHERGRPPKYCDALCVALVEAGQRTAKKEGDEAPPSNRPMRRCKHCGKVFVILATRPRQLYHSRACAEQGQLANIEAQRERRKKAKKEKVK